MIWRKSSFSAENGHCIEVAWRKSSFSADGGQCVEVAWRKASFSAEQGACVEVAAALGAVRDSKNPGGPVLRGNLTALVAAARLSVFKTPNRPCDHR